MYILIVLEIFVKSAPSISAFISPSYTTVTKYQRKYAVDQKFRFASHFEALSKFFS